MTVPLPPQLKPLGWGELRADLTAAGLSEEAAMQLTASVMAAFEGILLAAGMGCQQITLDLVGGQVLSVRLDCWDGEGSYLVQRLHRWQVTIDAE